MSTDFYQVIARYYPLAGQTETVLALLVDLAAASRTEPANIAYDFFRGVENADEIVIIESYTDAAGFAAHREAEHFERIGLGQIIPLLENRVVVKMNASLDA
ncbi:putative quinol monooxygenase [Microterricola viridarii]|uniref:Quinol monooxygenase YgiN n=1 Tax=Microterricola viridarii TaxID=412690 RepID=A0A1H1Z692_9MICO|nr:antibiotic biosynthesis monooxygenase family protein [Microterricola viridarii]SDT29345.1 Quinol monooxygenase YgiN [Microterricola viridarii]